MTSILTPRESADTVTLWCGGCDAMTTITLSTPICDWCDDNLAPLLTPLQRRIGRQLRKAKDQTQ